MTRRPTAIPRIDLELGGASHCFSFFGEQRNDKGFSGSDLTAKMHNMFYSISVPSLAIHTGSVSGFM